MDTGEPLWSGQDRKQETLDEFFRTQLSVRQRKRVEAACVDMWRPFTNSITQWARNCRIVYDKFHVLQHANKAIDEVRRAEFFRKGGRMRGVVKGKRWLLLTRWMNLDSQKRQQLNELFALNRRVMKAYLLKESLERLWTYRYEGAMLRYLQSWIDQLRWQRLQPFQKLAFMLLDHLDGILNYCRTKVPFGVVEAINGNIKTLLEGAVATRISPICCSRLSAWRSPRPNSSFFRKQPKMRVFTNSCAEPNLTKRSELGDDTLDNLITLCVTCHHMEHRFRLPLATGPPNRHDAPEDAQQIFRQDLIGPVRPC